MSGEFKFFDHGAAKSFYVFGLYSDVRHCVEIVLEPFKRCHTIGDSLSILSHMPSAELAGTYLYAMLAFVEGGGLVWLVIGFVLQTLAAVFNTLKPKEKPDRVSAESSEKKDDERN
jgi:hypothetical protein